MAKKETPATAPAVEQQPTQGLSLQDLVLVAQIIQLTTQRGAFKAEELASVGGLYNKLVAFLESTGAVKRAPEDATTQENPNA